MLHVFYNTPFNGLEHVCAVETDDIETLFREMNIVDGFEIPLSLGRRSLSVGDVIVDRFGLQGFRCEEVGWKELPSSEVRSLHRELPKDYRVFFPRCEEVSVKEEPWIFAQIAGAEDDYATRVAADDGYDF